MYDTQRCLFPTPIYSFRYPDHEEIKDTLIQTLEEIGYRPVGEKDGNPNAKQGSFTDPSLPFSKSYDLQLEEQFAPIVEFFNESLNFVMHDLGYREDQHIPSIWSTKQSRGNYHRIHKHRNCFLTGVYYLHGDGLSAGTTFVNFDVPSMILPSVDPDKEHKLREDYSLPFEEGMFHVFPSWLNHGTPVHNSDVTRYILSINSVPNMKEGIPIRY